MGLLDVAVGKAVDFGSSLLQRKWAQRDRAHAENRQDALLAQMWNREDAIRNELQEREDTSYQRSVSDASAAGLSPLAVNQLDSAGDVVSASMASQPDVMAPSSYMSNMGNTAADLSAAYFSQLNLDELKRHNKAMEKNERDKIDNSYYVDTAQLSLQADKISKDFEVSKENLSIEEKKRLDSVQALTLQLSQAQLFHLDDLKEKDKDRALESAEHQSQTTFDLYESMCKSVGVKLDVLPCYTLDEYNDALATFQSKFVSANRSFLNYGERKPDDVAESVMDSSSSSDSYGLKAGAFGADVGGNMSNGSSSSSGVTKNRYSQQRLQSFYSGLKCPVLMLGNRK